MRKWMAVALIALSACDGGLASDNMSNYQIEGVLKNGASIEISASRFSNYQTEGMAKAALEGGSMLTVRDASSHYSTYQMEGIGKAGPGHVKFE